MRRDDQNDSRSYDDIIHLPHHVSAVHPHMPVLDRAAQFSPFAALTGYGDAVKEEERLTDRRIELDEDAKSILDEKLRVMQEQAGKHPKAVITYFQPDRKKEGGAYITIEGHVKKIDTYERMVIFQEGMRIPIGEIVGIEGENPGMLCE